MGTIAGEGSEPGAADAAEVAVYFRFAGDVGVIQRLDVLAGNALPIAVALIVSTGLRLAVTALVFVARRAT